MKSTFKINGENQGVSQLDFVDNTAFYGVKFSIL
jgi:hypothetical protein